MRLSRPWAGALALACALATSPAALAGPNPTATAFAPSLQSGSSTLQLNGAGTRWRVMFKVYDMALYTPAPVASADALFAQPGPKQLQFTALREIPGTDLGLAFIKGLQANASREAVQKHAASSTRLIEIFSGRSKLMPGDTFAMSFEPGKGTRFFIQGQPQGAAVGDDEFFAMVLRIWLGPNPVDPQLRDALLGQAPRNAF